MTSGNSPLPRPIILTFDATPQGEVDPSVYNFGSLREWRSGAAPLGKDLQSLVETRWGVPVHSWYG